MNTKNFPWFKEDCSCIDCYCVRIGVNPLPGKIMHEIWEQQKKTYIRSMKKIISNMV